MSIHEPTFSAITQTRAYDPTIRSANRHYGQRKLALDEIDFLTRVCNVDNNDHVYVIYAGAAPGVKTAYVASLFPRVRLLMIDPADFDIKPHANVSTYACAVDELTLDIITQHNITCVQTFMNPRMIAKIRALMLPCLYFISDVRTACYHDDPEDSDICYNMAQQYNWIRALEPALSILKFRHPFYNQSTREFQRETNSILMQSELKPAREDGLDIIANYRADKLVFFDGELVLQAWAPNTSAETRLITDGKKLRIWGSHLVYEGKMFYYNTSIRRGVEFDTKPVAGMCNCADCALEKSIWEKYSPDGDIQKCVDDLSIMCDRKPHA